MRIKVGSTAAVTAILASLLATAAAQAAPIDNVFVFGDSLSDTGNLAELSGSNFPNPPFFHDSITNGPVAVELLAEHFGKRADPSLWVTGFSDTNNLFNGTLGLGAGKIGTNYAVAGAQAQTTGDGIDLLQQVGAFSALLGAQHVTADPNSLYTVFIGGNDVRTAAHAGNTAIVDQGVAAETIGINALIGDGAKKILVVNVGNVGAIPEFTQESPAGQAQTATLDSKLYNSELKTSVDGIQAGNPNVDITQFDFFDFSQNLDLASLGITNTTDPCLNSQFLPNPGCNFDTFAFWNDIHPTAKVQQAWGDGLIDAVPEPASLALFGVGLAGLAAIRRRKQA